MPDTAIADTSSLIALEKINLPDILCKIYDRILLPQAVFRESDSERIPRSLLRG
jgi:predicted nucleic acid-binding protein